MQTNRYIFEKRKIFVSWRAKPEAIYIVNIKKNKTKTRTPQFSLLISFTTVLLTVHIFGVPKHIAPDDLRRGGVRTVDMKSAMD